MATEASRTELWEYSAREAMLAALEAICGTIPGVNTVERQDPYQDAQHRAYPRIVIVSTDFSHQYISDTTNELLTRSVVDVHLMAMAPRNKTASHLRSTVREAFAATVVGKLLANRTLTVQLEGEAEPTAHCINLAPEPPAVQHLELDGGRIHTRIRFSDVQTCELFDERTFLNVANIVLELYPYGGDGVLPDTEISVTS